MKIAVIAHIRHAIAEPFQGGMEAQTDLLCSGLRKAGHEVILFAAGGSADSHLVPICERPYEEVRPWAIWRGRPELAEFQRRAFERAWQQIVNGDFDIVHNNSLFPELIDWAQRDDVPMVVSQHVPPFGAMREAVAAAAGRPGCRITVVSTSQAGLWFAEPPANFGVVHNGIDCAHWRPGKERSGRLVWSGRITPNKGLAQAVAACRVAGRALDIVGPMEDAGYFAQSVFSLPGERTTYRGHLAGNALRDLVAAADAMLVTPMWDEPFGLVAAEALACGVPVIGFERGAIPEVAGACGLLVSPGNVAALALALGRFREIDREACRRRAVSLFSVPAMVAGYENHYRDAIAGAGRHGRSPAEPEAASSSSASSTAALLA